MLALVALVLGVVNAGARSTATRTVTVQVLGKGTVKSSPGRDQLRRRKHEVLRRVQRHHGRRPHREARRWVRGRNLVGRLQRLHRHCVRPRVGRRQHRGRRVQPEVRDVPEHVDGDVCRRRRRRNGDREMSAPPSPLRPVARSTAATRAAARPVPGSSRPDRRYTVFQTPAAGSVSPGLGRRSAAATAASCTVQMDGDRQVGAAWATRGRLDGAAHRQRRRRGPRLGRRASTARAPASPTRR